MDIDDLAYVLESQGWAPIVTNGPIGLAGVQLQHTPSKLIMDLTELPGYHAYLANFVRVFTGSCKKYGPGKYLGLRVASIYEQLDTTPLDPRLEHGTLLTTGVYGTPGNQYVNDFYYITYNRVVKDAVSKVYQIPSLHLVATPVAKATEHTLHQPLRRWLLFTVENGSQLKVSGWLDNADIIHFMANDDFVLNPHLEG